MPSLFLTGATGYIGGAVLARLLDADAPKFDISVLVRGKDRAAAFERMGLRAVVGDLDDAALLQREAEAADVVVHTADASDHLPSCRALLAGAEARSARTQVPPLYIHTSGTGVLIDRARGASLSDKVYSDDDPAGIDALPDSALHRNVDIEVKKAGEKGKVRTRIVIPSIVYGTSRGKFKVENFFTAPLVLSALRSGKAGFVGTGRPAWGVVHVSDLADLYVLLVARPEGPAWGGYYFGETGEASFADVAKAVADAVKTRTGKDVACGEFTPDEVKKNLRNVGGATVWGSNARCKAVRGPKMGWKPRHTGLGPFRKGIEEQVNLLAEDMHRGKL
ncbi:NAD-P-binding protein [Hyaloraphidium curvatum]|nr:NAD-P-binding protein [Hyaloraphidium curvatum]